MPETNNLPPKRNMIDNAPALGIGAGAVLGILLGIARGSIIVGAVIGALAGMIGGDVIRMFLRKSKS